MNRRFISVLLMCTLMACSVNMNQVTVDVYAKKMENFVVATESMYDDINAKGGFYSDSEAIFDDKTPYVFVTESKEDTKKVFEKCGIEKKDTIVSRKIDLQHIVGAELTPEQIYSVIKEDIRIEHNYNVNGCAVTEVINENIQWYLEAMNVSDKMARGEGGRDVKVELLDSGVAYVSSLEDVKRVNLIPGEDDISSLFADRNGHGTALAGVICADSQKGEIRGINQNVELYSVKVLDTNLQAPISRIVEGIYWGIENDMDIINMSFGTSMNSEILHDAIKAADEAGILLVAAAGNDSELGVLYPAAYPEVIAVGSTDADGNVMETSASGDEVEIYAPGTQILSTGLFDGYTSCIGTSISTAEVTAVASRLMENENATADIVRELLTHTGKAFSENVSGKFIDCGYAEESYTKFVDDYFDGSIEGNDYENRNGINSYVTDGIVNGLWRNGAHEYLVEAAHGTVDDTLSVTHLTIMVYAATEIDGYKKNYLADYADEGASSLDYGGLHGLGAYTLNIKALWKYALLIGEGQTTAKALPNTMETLTDAELKLQEFGANPEKGRTKEMLLVAGKFLRWVKANNESMASNSTRKKYVIAGLVLHLIGDIYAHRTIVPNYAFDNAKTNSYASGDKSDFASYLGKSDFVHWNTLYSDYHEGTKITFVSLDKEKYVGADVTGFNKLYEDNEDFCRERLHASSKCSKAFLQKFVSSTNIPDPTIIKQYTNVNLIRFAKYQIYSS